MSTTLANKMRPKKLSDIIGQQHLVGPKSILTKFVEKKHPFSIILYGSPGCGKTTIAMCLANDLNIPYRLFNASTGNKKEMDAIIAEAKLSNGLFVIIDEVHRLNKARQDDLLSHVESGLITIAGCTTSNPYHSINPAIRSRCHILEVKPLTTNDIIDGLKQALLSSEGFNNEYTIEDSVLTKIAKASSGDIRFAYNCLEICSIICDNNHIDENVLDMVAESIKQIRQEKIETCIVIGGGKFYRGVNNTNKSVSRPIADQAGMIATVINALFLKSILDSKGIKSEILSGLSIPQVAETYSYRSAQNLLKQGTVVIFAGGTGNPYFTTDTGATLRALETECDALFKATQVDGVYDSDPKKNPNAIRYKTVSYDDVITKELKVMDMTAISMARENKLPIVVFKQVDKDSLINAIKGKGNFTIIK